MQFQNAWTSVIGYTHHSLYYNNQDACAFYQDRDLIIGVVADGCGSCGSSEVGARLGVDFTVNFCRKTCGKQPFDGEAFHDAAIDYLQAIVNNQHTREKIEFIDEHLLFTLVGFVVTPETTTVFHSGDGFFMINGEETMLDENNRPAYLGKELYGHKTTIKTKSLPTADINQLLVSTDGIRYLRDALVQQPVQGLTALPDLFLREDFFSHPAALPKFITALTVEEKILRDDTSVVLLKR